MLHHLVEAIIDLLNIPVLGDKLSVPEHWIIQLLCSFNPAALAWPLTTHLAQLVRRYPTLAHHQCLALGGRRSYPTYLTKPYKTLNPGQNLKLLLNPKPHHGASCTTMANALRQRPITISGGGSVFLEGGVKIRAAPHRLLLLVLELLLGGVALLLLPPGPTTMTI